MIQISNRHLLVSFLHDVRCSIPYFPLWILANGWGRKEPFVCVSLIPEHIMYKLA